jgi:hypothetical protein
MIEMSPLDTLRNLLSVGVGTAFELFSEKLVVTSVNREKATAICKPAGYSRHRKVGKVVSIDTIRFALQCEYGLRQFRYPKPNRNGRIYFNAHITENGAVLVGYRGAQFMEEPQRVYFPYIPLYQTPDLIERRS